MIISANDKKVLRRLASEQLELAHSDINQDRIRLWYLHNSCRGERPMIHLELGTFEHEVIDPMLCCENEHSRSIERMLYRNFLNFKLFDDDMVVPDFFPIGMGAEFIPFGIDVQIHHESKEDLGFSYVHPISDLREDYHKLGDHIIKSHKPEAISLQEEIADLFGDILEPKLQSGALYAVPTQQLVKLMGMENMCIAMYDCPELICDIMTRLADGYLSYFDFLKKENILTPTAGHQWVGQGTLAYNRILPSDNVTDTKQMWGFLDSQETVSISPLMFKELIFPCYEKIASQYGLLSYGCCEPVDAIWESCLSRLENLKKVSISPWCNEEYMGERLRSRDTIFHRKPSPNFLGVGAALNEDAFKAHINATVAAASGCTLEITQRDVYTINHDIKKAQRYVQIIRECTTEAYSQ